MAVKTKRNCGYCGTYSYVEARLPITSKQRHFVRAVFLSLRISVISRQMSGRKGGMVKEMEALGASTLPPELRMLHVTQFFVMMQSY